MALTTKILQNMGILNMESSQDKYNITATRNTGIDARTSQVSSGFHMVEMNFPSSFGSTLVIGGVILVLLLVLFVAVHIGFCCFYKLKMRKSKHKHAQELHRLNLEHNHLQQPPLEPIPFAPYPMPVPQVYPSIPLDKQGREMSAASMNAWIANPDERQKNEYEKKGTHEEYIQMRDWFNKLY